ncbi:MAG: penicillin-insensitive murein endopeptidase [Deltaproteobacteria bacterium]|nr:penicillin-insensitive murein endopeptidase [Deltaproteobacteria bacterium]
MWDARNSTRRPVLSRRALAWCTCLFIVGGLAPSALAYRYQHEVLPGEHLADIARLYRVPEAKLKNLNKLKGTRLRAGQTLTVVTSLERPTRRKVRHAVKAGQTLARIAKTYKMKLPLLRRLNPRHAEGALRPGQQLWVVEETAPLRRPGGRGLYQLESGPGYAVRNAERAFGTFLTVTRLQDVFAAYARRYASAPAVTVYDLSTRHGGFLKPHRSHRGGRDVDIAYALKTPGPKWGAATPATLHLERTWFLLKTFLKTKDVTYIFVDLRLQRAIYKHALKTGAPKAQLDELFQCARGSQGRSVVIRHEPGHATHFHVRFRPEARDEEPTT